MRLVLLCCFTFGLNDRKTAHIPEQSLLLLSAILVSCARGNMIYVGAGTGGSGGTGSYGGTGNYGGTAGFGGMGTLGGTGGLGGLGSFAGTGSSGSLSVSATGGGVYYSTQCTYI